MERNERIAKLDLEGRFLVDRQALGVSKLSRVGSVDRHSILVGEALSLNVLDAVLLEGDLLADADVTLDAEVSELAALGACLMSDLLIGAASRLLVVNEADVGLCGNVGCLVGLELLVRRLDALPAKRGAGQRRNACNAWSHIRAEAAAV